MEEFSTIRKIDDSTIEIATYEMERIGTSFTISFGKILVIILIVIFCSLTFFLATHNNATETDKTYLEDYNTVFDKDGVIFSPEGFVFPESSTQYITSNDLDNLVVISNESDYTYQELLRFAVNEIYARHGYQFAPGGRFDAFYSQYQWYVESIKADVTWDMFNDYECHNLNLIINEEERNGYRH